MRQLRVKNESCEIHKDFQNAILNCWSPYSSSIEEKSDFFPKHRYLLPLFFKHTELCQGDQILLLTTYLSIQYTIRMIYDFPYPEKIMSKDNKEK